MPDLLSVLADVLAAECVVSDPGLLARLSADEAAWVVPGRPVAAVLPRGRAEVVAAVQVAAALGVPVVPRGAGTGLSGGAAASEGCLVVCTERMTDTAPSGGTSRPTPAASAACAGVPPGPTSWPWTWCSPTARCCARVGATARAWPDWT